MITKIKRQEAFTKYPNFPWYNYRTDDFFFPKSYRNIVLTIKSKSAKGHAANLSAALTKLSRDIGFDSLVFLGDSKTAWLYQDNEYQPVKDATLYLLDNKVGKKFNGALEVSIDSLKEFFKHLFWLRRCNAALPIFYFMDKEQNIVGNICKHGNIHIHFLNEEISDLFERLMPEGKFEYFNGSYCYDNFSKSGAIKGRRIVV
jgi:hypothetical protein